MAKTIPLALSGSSSTNVSDWWRKEDGNIEFPTILRGVLNKKNLLDLIENFILYGHYDGRNVKKYEK